MCVFLKFKDFFEFLVVDNFLAWCWLSTSYQIFGKNPTGIVEKMLIVRLLKTVLNSMLIVLMRHSQQLFGNNSHSVSRQILSARTENTLLYRYSLNVYRGQQHFFHFRIPAMMSKIMLYYAGEGFKNDEWEAFFGFIDGYCCILETKVRFCARVDAFKYWFLGRKNYP